MRIVYLNHNYEGLGTYFRCLNLARTLGRRGHEVTIICASRGNFDLRIRRKQVGDGVTVVTLPRVRIHEYHTGHFFRGVLGSILAVTHPFDLIHAFAVAQPATALPAIASRVRPGTPLAVDWDDAWTGGFALSHPPVVQKVLKAFEWRVPRLSRAVTVVSQFLQKQAVADVGISPERVFVVPNGADVNAIQPVDRQTARSRLNLPPDIPILMSVGHTYMGTLTAMVEAIRSIRTHIPEAMLYIVGRPGSIHYEAYEEPGVVFTGEQPFSSIPYYLGAADVLLMPMQDSAIDQARFPIRLGDYLASGRPIVANAVGEVGRILRQYDCGIAVEGDNPSDIALAALKLLNNAGLAASLSVKAREVAEGPLSWESIGAELERIYRTIVPVDDRPGT
jgi:glycosyltransferase involved in cell wall biosynthesis